MKPGFEEPAIRSQMNPVHILTLHFFKVHFNIVLYLLVQFFIKFLNDLICSDSESEFCVIDLLLMIRNIYDKKLYLTEFNLQIWQLDECDMTACLPVTAQRDKSPNQWLSDICHY
jgi:hypothetical protein